MDGIDGLVLSSETAVGEYPVESLLTSMKLATSAEGSANYLEYQAKVMRFVDKPIHTNESIASSAVLCARQVGASLIVCITEVGGTARLVAKYRPQIPVIAATIVEKTARQMVANFGVVPYFHEGPEDQVISATMSNSI
jgi:pyruvate kinase